MTKQLRWDRLAVVLTTVCFTIAAHAEPLADAVQAVIDTPSAARRDPDIAAELEGRLSEALAANPDAPDLDVSNADWLLVDLRSTIGDHRGAALSAERFLIDPQMHPSARMDVAYRVAEQWFLADPLADDRWLYFDRAQAIAEELAPRRSQIPYDIRYSDLDLDLKRAELLLRTAGEELGVRDPRFDDPFLRAEQMEEAGRYFDRYRERLQVAGYPIPGQDNARVRERERLGVMDMLARAQFEVANELAATAGSGAATPIFQEVSDRLQDMLLQENARDLIDPRMKEQFADDTEIALRSALEFESPESLRARAETLLSEIPPDRLGQFFNQAEFMVLNGERLDMAAVLTLLEIKYRRKWHPDTYQDDRMYWSTLFRFFRLVNGKLIAQDAVNQVLAYIVADADLISRNAYALEEYGRMARLHGLPELPDRTNDSPDRDSQSEIPKPSAQLSPEPPSAHAQAWWWTGGAACAVAIFGGWFVWRRSLRVS